MKTEEPKEIALILECVIDVISESKNDIEKVLGNKGAKDIEEIIRKIDLLILNIENYKKDDFLNLILEIENNKKKEEKWKIYWLKCQEITS